LRQPERRELLAHAVGAREEVGVVDAPVLEGTLEGAQRGDLRADQREEGLGHRSSELLGRLRVDNLDEVASSDDQVIRYVAG
jgi:hypothetical protein